MAGEGRVPNEALQAALRRLRWSPYRLAREVNHVMGVGYIHRSTPLKWAAYGAVPHPPLPELVAEILSDALGEPVTVPALWPGRAGTRPAPVMADPTPVPDPIEPRTLEEILDQWDALMRRREFVESSLAVAVIPAAPLTVVSAEALRAHLDLTDTYRRLDNLHGPGAVFSQALDHYRQLTGWHRGLLDPAHRRRVAGVAARAGAFVGWLCHDMGRWMEAGQYYRQAAELAADAGDLNLYCHLVNGMSRTLAECGRLAEARAFADAAVRKAGTAAHPAVQWYLRADRALLHAQAGEDAASQVDQNAALALVELADDGEAPPYAFTHDAAVWKERSARIMITLGRTMPSMLRDGAEAIDRARETWPAALARGEASVYALSARARVAQGDVEAAAEFTRRAYEIASGTGSVRNLRRAAEARALLQPHRRAKAVRDLDDHLLSKGS